MPQVVFSGHEAESAYGIALRLMFDEAAAKRGVVVDDGLKYLLERHIVFFQLAWVHNDMKLFRQPAPRVDFAYPFDRAQAITDLPIVHGFFRHGIAVFTDNEILVDFPEGGCHRTEGKGNARRQALAGLSEPLGDELAGEVERNVIVEHDGDQRESEFGQRAHLYCAGNTHHGAFQRVGDALFDLDGSEPRGFGDHHHCNAR